MLSSAATGAAGTAVRRPPVRIAVFGPTTATVDTETVPLGPRKQRMLLSILVGRAGTTISSDALVDALWDGRPPSSASANVRLYVHQLRRVLGRSVIAGSAGPGYRLDVDEVATDSADLDRLCAAAEVAVNRSDLADARRLLSEAVALRRGRAFADVGDHPVSAGEARDLEERWLLAVQRRVDVDLGLGRSAELVGELTGLTANHPYQERLWEQLMLALSRAQRPGEALRVYQHARRILVEELGIEPGPALRILQQRILAADPTVSVAPPGAGAAVRPAQLPLDVRGYLGRTSELSALDALLSQSGGRPTATVIAAVSGPAGAGKTALAVHWGHRVVDRFPDGQLYLNLRGFDPTGVRLGVEEALQELLSALGVAPTSMPVGATARAGLYRSVLADRRMLIVLDNAYDDDQVRPLLPGAPGCMVVVTSRSQLAGLIATEDASPVQLDVLDDAAARQMLAERIGVDRASAEPRAIEEMVERCAHLPLALAVVAARAATRPGFRLCDLARELTEVHTPLDAFHGPDPASDLRAVFSWSYHALGVLAARLFRLIGLHGGPHLTAAAAASLAGEPLAVVRPVLAELTRAHLLTEFQPGRYTFHDLLRAYALELVMEVEDDAERAAVIRRMLDHYLQTAQLAAVLHRPGQSVPTARPGVTLEPLADRRGGRAWLAVEHRVLLRMIALCHGRPTGGLLPFGPVAYHLLAEHREAIRVYLRVSEAYRDVDDPYGRATDLNRLGDAHRSGGDEESARRTWKMALAMLEELGSADAEQVRAKIDDAGPNGSASTGRPDAVG